MKNGELISAPAGAEVVELIERPPAAPTQQPVNPLILAHSLLRGRYHWAISLALIGAMLGAVGGYFVLPPTYRSAGIIHVKPTLPVIMEQNDVNAPIPRFDGFVSSQVQLIKSRRVVDLAMLDENWKKFGRGVSDRATAEFIESLEVQSPKGSELIQVTFADRDPAAAAAAVTAVINAYLDFHKDFDTETGVPRMTMLEQIRDAHSSQLELKQRAIQSILQEFGNELAMQRRLEGKINYVEELESEIGRIRIALAPLPASARGAPDVPATQPAMDDLRLLVNPEMRELRRQKRAAERRVQELAALYGNDHREMVKARAAVASLEQEIADHAAVMQLAEGAHGAQGGAIEGLSPERLRAAEQELRSLHRQADIEMKELGRKHLELERLKDEVVEVRKKLDDTRARIYSLETEQRNVGGRITMVNEGDRPVGPYKDRRKALAAVGAMGLAGLGVGCILLVGLSDRRLHRIADASAQIQRNSKVLGIVPEIADQSLDFGSATVAAHCVHQIRAMLQMRGAEQQRQAFAITSPAAGDGKTTVAIALAMSFAASGTRTLLIDLDLIGGGLSARVNRMAHRKLGQVLLRNGGITQRQLDDALETARREAKRLGDVLVQSSAVTTQQLEEALLAQLRTSVGLGDVLAGERLIDCVAPTGLSNLFILPLGTAGREQISRLSPDLIRRIIAEAQESFAPVVIDTGPILGSLEAAMLAGSDAGIILTVSRGSNKALTRRAIQFLNDAGVRLEGVVFNRAEENDLQASGFSSYATRVSQSVHVARSSQPQLGHVAGSTKVEASGRWSRSARCK